MTTTPRFRITGHRRVRAGDLVPHELNPRTHSAAQRAALAALYREIGFARSLLAYELPDGRLKLIDGHLRRALDPDMEVEVEVLDELRRATDTSSDVLRQLWDALAANEAAVAAELGRAARTPPDGLPEQYLIVVECRDEPHQVELLERFHQEGLACQAKIA